MNQIITELNYIKHNALQVSMIYLKRVKRRTGYEYFGFDVPIRANIRDEIKIMVIDNTMGILEGKTLSDFSPTYTESGTVEALPIQCVNNYDCVYKVITSNLLEDTNDLNFQDIWGYCIIVDYEHENTNKKLVFFKKYNYPKLLRKGIILSLLNGVYNKIDSDVVSIDSDMHSFEYDSTMFVLNKSQFEKFFNFSSAYQEIVAESIETLKQLDVIENFDDFAQQCLSSDQLTRRLVKTISNDRFSVLQRHIINVPQVIEDFSLNIRFNNNKIIFDDDTTATDVITLINGACVVGALDQERYLANDTKRLS